MQVIKKDGTLEEYNEQKIIDACNKAARRAMVELNSKDYTAICDAVWEKLVENDLEDTEIYEMHNIVESVLQELYPNVAKMYKEYRNYKKDFIHMMDKVYERSQAIRYIGDKSNANTDSALVATKRSLIYNELSSELYKKFFLTRDEKQAMKDGYIYIHDRSARLDTFNCFTRDTKFITCDGIKSFLDFKDGDTTYVISHKGIIRKATIHELGIQEIQCVELMSDLNNLTYVYCTKNHRWLLNNGTETTELQINNELVKNPYTGEIWTVEAITPINEKERVWCLNVEVDHSFLLEGGVPTGNCDLFRVGHVMKDGFEMGNVWYNEPGSLDTAFDVMGDIILSTAAQQYGGFTVPEVDKILESYARKSYVKYFNEYDEITNTYGTELGHEYAMKKVKRDFEQGWQGIEYKLNTVGSSRGDYPSTQAA